VNENRKAARMPLPQRYVLRVLRAHAPSLGLLLPLAIVEVALDGGLTLSYRYLIDDAILPANGRALVVVLGALALGVLVASFAGLARDGIYARRVAAILDDLRRALFDHIQRLSIPSIARRSSGDLVARFSTDLAGVETALVGAMGGVVLPALGVAVGVALLFVVLDWRAALVGSLVWPLVLIGPRFVAPRAAVAAYEKKEREAALLVKVDEAVQAYRTVRAFGLQPFVRGRFVGALGALSSGTARATFLSALVERTTVVAIYAIQVLAVAAGAFLAYRRLVSVGSLVSFLTIFWNLGWSLVVMGRSTPSLVAAFGSARRIDELLDETEDAADAADLPSLGPLCKSIKLEDVSFSYDHARAALLFATLEIRAGESVAFVGPSGSGKSTALGLIARFYDASLGKVTVDGVDVRTVSAASLRAQMALVMQESFLFDTTVGENIRLGRPGATDAEIEQAAREAEIHDTIAAMPRGYDTRVGERGSQLSGGQRQRIAIARALVRRPAVLLLDEASSALDPAAEAAINETLARAARGRTTISVTHRLAGAVNADRIFVVRDKRIVEQGTHTELLARGRVYADLWGKQSGFVVSSDGARAEVTAERLRTIALLAPLSDAQLAALASSFVCEHATPGERVIEEGRAGNLFYLIARGQVRVTRRLETGEELDLARLEDGDQFGELALLRDAPRNATVTATRDSLFLTLDRQRFLELLESTPGVRDNVERVAAQRTAALRESSLARTLQ
jgi:ATP-binding cassette subfamily B protein